MVVGGGDGPERRVATTKRARGLTVWLDRSRTAGGRNRRTAPRQIGSGFKRRPAFTQRAVERGRLCPVVESPRSHRFVLVGASRHHDRSSARHAMGWSGPGRILPGQPPDCTRLPKRANSVEFEPPAIRCPAPLSPKWRCFCGHLSTLKENPAVFAIACHAHPPRLSERSCCTIERDIRFLPWSTSWS